MVLSSVIEIKITAAAKMVSTNEKEGDSSPVLMNAASLDSGGEDIGGGGSLLCLWAENSSRMWMVCSRVLEKIKISSCENGV